MTDGPDRIDQPESREAMHDLVHAVLFDVQHNAPNLDARCERLMAAIDHYTHTRWAVSNRLTDSEYERDQP